MFGLWSGLSLLARIGIIAGIVASALGAVAYVHHRWVAEGKAIERARIEQQNQKAKSSSDRAARTPDECNDKGGNWNVITSKCESN
jgi:hypothetical protein